MAKYCEPMVSTRIVNPTQERQAYRWINNGVIFLEPGQETILPFEIMTATPADNRYLIEETIAEKRVELEYLVRGIAVKQVNSLHNDKVVTEVAVAQPDLLLGTEKKEDTVKVQDKLPARPLMNFMNNDVVKQAPDQTNPTAVPGQKVKTFREVMGWPKQEVQQAPEPVKLGDAWAAAIIKPRT